MKNQDNRKQQWEKKVEAWSVSGLSAGKWCLQQQIPLSSFRYWQNKVLKEKPGKDSFFELIDESTRIELECSGIKIHISKDFDENLLLRCLSILKRYSC